MAERSGVAARVRCGAPAALRRRRSRPRRPARARAAMPATASISRVDVAVVRWRRRSRRSASTRRRRAACSPRSRRRRQRRGGGRLHRHRRGRRRSCRGQLARMMRTRPPSLGIERELWEAGHEVVVGVDEVGRGAWAGPLSVGAAVLPADRRVYKVRDSKMLTEAEREKLFYRIAVVVRHVGGRSRDAGGVRRDRHVRRAAPRGAAGDRGARRRARCDRRRRQVGLRLAGGADGEGASHGQGRRDVPVGRRLRRVLAKVTRDRIMRAEAEHFPGYDFDANKGYPCPRHKAALRGMGADVDPPAHLGVHGPPALAGDASPPAGAGTAVRSLIAPAGITSAARSRSRSRSRCSSRRARRPCRAACSRSGPSPRGSLRPLPRRRRGCRPTGQ